MEINEESCKSFGNGGKVRKFWIITIEFRLKKKKTNTKKWSTNLNSFMWGKLLNQKKKKVKKKWVSNNNNNNNNKNLVKTKEERKRD